MSLRETAERIVEMFPQTGHRDGITPEEGLERDIQCVEDELLRLIRGLNYQELEHDRSEDTHAAIERLRRFAEDMKKYAADILAVCAAAHNAAIDAAMKG